MITNPVLGNLGKQTGASYFAAFVPAAIGVGFLIGSLIFLLMIIWGAIEWIASGGDKQKLESARTRITNALVGILILFGTFAILNIIQTFFGIKILTLDIGPLVIQ